MIDGGKMGTCCIQYWSEADREAAEWIKDRYMSCEIVRTDTKTDIEKYNSWIIVGGPDANPVYDQVKGTPMPSPNLYYQPRNPLPEDGDNILILVGYSTNPNLFDGQRHLITCASWTKDGTLAGAYEIYNNGIRDSRTDLIADIPLPFGAEPVEPIPSPVYVPPTEPPTAPTTVIEEETADYWTSQGYSSTEAGKIAAWVREKKMTPSPETITEIIAPEIVYASVVPPEFVHETGTAVAAGFGEVWDTLAGGIDGLAKGFGEGVDYVVNNIDTLAIDAIITGVSFLALEALFARIATAYPAASRAVTALSTSKAAAPAVVMTTKQLAAALIKNPKNSAALLKGLSKTRFNNVFKELQSTAAGKTAERTIYTEYLKTVEMQSGVTGILQHFGQHWKMVAGGVGLLMGMGFAVPWGAKEWIWESMTIPYSDLIRGNEWDLAEKYLPDIKTLAEVCKTSIAATAWLNPISYNMFKAGLTNIDLDIAMWEEQIAAGKGIIKELPEQIRATVRDIVDGDTIEVDVEAKGAITGEVIKLPEYKTSGHASVRIVGINSPEKSPKGEIACTDIEIYKVAKTYADLARDALLTLNDKEVLLKIDPDKQSDTYGRILAVVEYMGVDIGLKQIQEGLACYYYREPHKYVNDAIYKDDTINAKDERVGMWSEVEKAAPELLEELPKFAISIDSSPTRAKVYVDNVYTHHLTPSNEVELKDVMRLFTPGAHTIKVTKSNLMAEKIVEITEGDNGSIMLTLEVPGLVPVIEEVEVVEEMPVAERTDFEIKIYDIPGERRLTPEEVTVTITPAPIAHPAPLTWRVERGKTYTIKVESPGFVTETWTEDAEMSMQEIEFDMYPVEVIPLTAELPPLSEWTDNMKAVARAILLDVEAETAGALQLSAAELANMKIKYGVA